MEETFVLHSIGCKKGNRDCVYPEPPASKGAKTDRSLSPQRQSPKSSNDEDYDTNDADVDHKTRLLETIEDEHENEHDDWPDGENQKSPRQTRQKTPVSRLPKSRRSSEDLSQDGYRTSSPSASTSGSTAATQLQDFNLTGDGAIDWSHLPQDYQYHLEYFTANVTNFHYSIANDGDQFFGHILPALALRHEPLLNALVGFSAYHATLQNSDGKLEDFLKYYNKSVTLLIGTLQRSEASNIYTLVTILQLMTIEVRCLLNRLTQF